MRISRLARLRRFLPKLGAARGRLSWRFQLGTGLAVGLLALALQLGSLGHVAEHKGLNLLFLLRGALAEPEDIVIVAVDDASFRELGLQWPWPRSLHARLIDRLAQAGAKVIAVDILFSEPSVPANDRALAEAIRRAGNVVLAMDRRQVETTTVEHTLETRPIPLFADAAAGVGVVNMLLDGDGVVRRAQTVFGEHPSFAALVARKAGATLPAGSAPFQINFIGPSPAVPVVSYFRALDPTKVPDGAFRDKVVLVGRAVGPAGSPVDDSLYTPFFWLSGRITPGVELHATIVDTLLRDRPVRPVHWLAGAAWALAWTLAAAWVAGSLAPLTGALVVILMLGVQAAALVVFVRYDVWVPGALPAAACALVFVTTMVVRWRRSVRDRAFLQRAFQHYVDPAVVKEIIERPDRLKPGGEVVEATILFSDLAGFTRISEGLTPEGLIALINQYLEGMTRVILAHGGMLNQTMGDGILALWNVPLRNRDHAVDACRAAFAMQGTLVELNREWAAEGRPALKMRIGIQTGEVVVGNIGSSERFQYGVIGDNVNLASRLEGVNKLYGTGVIVGDDTAREARHAFLLRPLDLIRVMGKQEPVRIHECLGPHGETPESFDQVLHLFAMGLSAYQGREWRRALEYFEQASLLAPDDGPTRVYVERARRFLAEPPPQDWDGVYTAATKEG